jgi:hypothetical protein
VLCVRIHERRGLVRISKEAGEDRSMCLELCHHGWSTCKIGVADWEFVEISPIIACVVIQLLAKPATANPVHTEASPLAWGRNENEASVDGAAATLTAMMWQPSRPATRPHEPPMRCRSNASSACTACSLTSMSSPSQRYPKRPSFCSSFSRTPRSASALDLSQAALHSVESLRRCVCVAAVPGALSRRRLFLC